MAEEEQKPQLPDEVRDLRTSSQAEGAGGSPDALGSQPFAQGDGSRVDAEPPRTHADEVDASAMSIASVGEPAPVVHSEATAIDHIAPPPHDNFLRTIFVGPNGIRAGWRLLIYLLILMALSTMVRLATRPFIRIGRGQAPTPKLMIAFELISFIVAVVASVIMAGIEREKWGRYGLPLRRAVSRDFWLGCLWGFVALTCVLRAAGAYHIDGLALHGSEIVKWALVWGAMFLLVGLFEEFFVRGYLLYTLASGITFWPAAVLTSSIFFFAHVRNPGENWYGLADVFVIGMFLCFTLWKTGDLWFAVGLHAVWDWGQSYFYSVPDSGLVVPGHLFHMHMSGPAWLSGGSAGPEGSVVNLVMDLLLFFVFAVFYKRRRWTGMTERRRESVAGILAPTNAGENIAY